MTLAMMVAWAVFAVGVIVVGTAVLTLRALIRDRYMRRNGWVHNGADGTWSVRKDVPIQAENLLGVLLVMMYRSLVVSHVQPIRQERYALTAAVPGVIYDDNYDRFRCLDDMLSDLSSGYRAAVAVALKEEREHHVKVQRQIILETPTGGYLLSEFELYLMTKEPANAA